MSVPDSSPDLVLEQQDPAGAKPNTGIFVVLVGILLTLLGILYVAIRHTGVFDQPAAEARCEALEGRVVISDRGGRVCDLPPRTPDGGRFGPEDFAVDEWAQVGGWSEKELHCQDIGGRVVWTTHGGKVCDVAPMTEPGQNFGDTDWIIEEGKLVNPFGE